MIENSITKEDMESLTKENRKFVQIVNGGRNSLVFLVPAFPCTIASMGLDS
jgi:hypothetical protein